MFKIKLFFLLMLFAGSGFTEDFVDGIAEFICHTVFSDEEYQYRDHFSSTFIEAISEEQFRAFVNEATSATGTCKRVEPLTTTKHAATVRLFSAARNLTKLSFSIDVDGRINGLMILDVELVAHPITSWDQAVSYLDTLGEKTSLTIETFHHSKKELRSSLRHPLASGFKLYVLAAVANAVKKDHLSFSTKFPIRDEHKSLPSGIMHTQPAGVMFSLYDFAEHMIKISDNTATDHLINIVGRSQVEDEVHRQENSFADDNAPFLTTAEAFKLKWAAPSQIIREFVDGSVTNKRTMLKTVISAIPLSAVGTNHLPMNEPTLITDIEWFGSTNDLCTAMHNLKEMNSAEVFSALSKNTPFAEVGALSPWNYAGFKGGSEPGVLTATYLLEDHEARWTCVSLAWHDEEKNINSFVFFDAVRKILNFTAKTSFEM